MLTAVNCGLLFGVRGYEDLVEWLHDQTVDVWHWMGYTRQPPKKDCYRDLLMKLDPDSLERALWNWITQELQLSDADHVLAGVSLDGKTLCGPLRPFERAVHLFAAVDHQTGCVLSQCQVNEKTNEHKAALKLLTKMVLKGRVIVADAMFCQRDLCRQVVDSGGDYLVSVEDNQPGLLREITQEFTAEVAVFPPYQQRQCEADTQTVSCFDKGNGRRERRTLTSTTALNHHLDWPGAKQVCRVVRERTIGGQPQIDTAYFITSLSRHQAR